MPILNYTTGVSANQTVGEIQSILARAGAKTVTVDYDDDGQPVAVMFSVHIASRWVSFRLPSNHTGVLLVLTADPGVPNKLKTDQQARHVAWRITKQWVAAQMAIIESRQAEMAEVFLPYVVTSTGKTLYQEFVAGRLQLGDGAAADNAD